MIADFLLGEIGNFGDMLRGYLYDDIVCTIGIMCLAIPAILAISMFADFFASYFDALNK